MVTERQWQQPWVRAALKTGRSVPSWIVSKAKTAEEFAALFAEHEPGGALGATH